MGRRSFLSPEPCTAIVAIAGALQLACVAPSLVASVVPTCTWPRPPALIRSSYPHSSNRTCRSVHIRDSVATGQALAHCMPLSPRRTQFSDLTRAKLTLFILIHLFGFISQPSQPLIWAKLCTLLFFGVRHVGKVYFIIWRPEKMILKHPNSSTYFRGAKESFICIFYQNLSNSRSWDIHYRLIWKLTLSLNEPCKNLLCFTLFYVLAIIILYVRMSWRDF